LQDEPSNQRWVDLSRRIDLPPGGFLDLREDLARLVVRELVRRRELDGEPALLGRDERGELLVDARELGGAPLLDDHEQEVPHQFVGVAEELAERRLLRAEVDLGVFEQRAQLGDRARGLDEVAALLGDLADTVLLPRRVEEGAGVDAVGDGYRSPSDQIVLAAGERQAMQGRKERS
jgi:hypothetical protein